MLCEFLLKVRKPAPGFSDLGEMQGVLKEVIAVLREQENTGYNAFISYHHTPETIAFARKLQARLENYRVPGGRKGEQKPFARVFLDKNELACVSDLRQELEHQLKQAQFLIVLCSGETAAAAAAGLPAAVFLRTAVGCSAERTGGCDAAVLSDRQGSRWSHHGCGVQFCGSGDLCAGLLHLHRRGCAGPGSVSSKPA